MTISSGSTLQINNNDDLTLATNGGAATIANKGEIALDASVNATALLIGTGAGTTAGTLTLTGGVIELSDSGNNYIYGNVALTTLDNINNTIAGAGDIYSNSGDLSITNQASGVIEASQTNNVLELDNIDITNDGTVESTGAAGLLLTSMTLNQTGGGVLEANGGRSRSAVAATSSAARSKTEPAAA